MSAVQAINTGLIGTSKYGQYYRHSGQINVGGMLVAAVAGLLAGAVMAPVYSAAIIFVPFIKLRFIGCFFFGAGLGVVPATLMKKLKVRNVPISLLVILVVTLFGYYFSWVSWEAILVRRIEEAPSFLSLLTHPNYVYNLANVVEQNGTWSLGESYGSNSSSSNNAVSGAFLLAIWIAEAALIIGSGFFLAASMLKDTPFCETCDQWVGTAKTVRLTAPTDVKTLRSKLETGDFAYVAALPAPTSSGVLTFMQHRCEKCKQLSTLTVKARTIIKNKKGQIKSNKAKTVINKLLVSNEDIQKMLPAAAIVPANPGVAAVEAPVVATAPVTSSKPPPLPSEKKPMRTSPQMRQ